MLIIQKNKPVMRSAKMRSKKHVGDLHLPRIESLSHDILLCLLILAGSLARVQSIFGFFIIWNRVWGYALRNIQKDNQPITNDIRIKSPVISLKGWLFVNIISDWQNHIISEIQAGIVATGAIFFYEWAFSRFLSYSIIMSTTRNK